MGCLFQTRARGQTTILIPGHDLAGDGGDHADDFDSDELSKPDALRGRVPLVGRHALSVCFVTLLSSILLHS
jgi:hypothetical protein